VTPVAFAVAGGRSLRMGRDKALLPWGQATLLDHTLDRLRAVCADVRILSGPEPRYLDRGLPVISDLTADAGPLAGIEAGLASPGVEAGLFLGIDLPFLPAELLRALIAEAAQADAVVPMVGGHPEPLCAVYGAGCLEPVRGALRAGDRKMTSFWPKVRVRHLSEDAIARFGAPAALFANVNTPDDYARARGR
jgi:molybdenum cofactor guanylyltransferase